MLLGSWSILIVIHQHNELALAIRRLAVIPAGAGGRGWKEPASARRDRRAARCGAPSEGASCRKRASQKSRLNSSATQASGRASRGKPNNQAGLSCRSTTSYAPCRAGIGLALGDLLRRKMSFSCSRPALASGLELAAGRVRANESGVMDGWADPNGLTLPSGSPGWGSVGTREATAAAGLVVDGLTAVAGLLAAGDLLVPAGLLVGAASLLGLALAGDSLVPAGLAAAAGLLAAGDLLVLAGLLVVAAGLLAAGGLTAAGDSLGSAGLAATAAGFFLLAPAGALAAAGGFAAAGGSPVRAGVMEAAGLPAAAGLAGLRVAGSLRATAGLAEEAGGRARGLVLPPLPPSSPAIPSAMTSSISPPAGWSSSAAAAASAGTPSISSSSSSLTNAGVMARKEYAK